MKLKEWLENIGYNLFLRDDVGIQREFQLRKKKLNSQTYSSKVALLITLILRRKYRGFSTYKEWEKKNSKLPFPVRRPEVYDDTVSAVMAVQDDETVMIDFWQAAVIPIFGNLKRVEQFLIGRGDNEQTAAALRQECLMHSLENPFMTEWIRKRYQKSREKTFLICKNQEMVRNAVRWVRRHWDFEPVFLDYRETKKRIGGYGNRTICYIVGEKKNYSIRKKDTVIQWPSCSEAQALYHIYPEYAPVRYCYETICDRRFFWNRDTSRNNYFYQFGYIYGGILILGMGRWLYESVIRKKIDKLFFLSRDCDLLYHYFKKNYPDIKSVYLHISRRAIAEAMFRDFPVLYVRNVFVPRMGYGDMSVSLGTVLREMDLLILEDALSAAGLSMHDRLNYRIYDNLVLLMKQNYHILCQKFEPSRKAAIQYMRSEFKDVNQALVVDVGWNGSVFRYLQRISRQDGWKCRLNGALLGAMEGTDIGNRIATGEVDTYLFSNERTSLYKGSRKEPYNNLQVKVIETIFGSTKNRLAGYVAGKDGSVLFRYETYNPEKTAIHWLQKGIYDFLKEMQPAVCIFGLEVSPEDAFLPLSYFLGNKKYVDKFDQILHYYTKAEKE